uniref:Uncharacterized protein n=1 Tax=Oryza punctata TaxID=4537 RepID=A0A0E0MI81_ORYPU
MAVGVEVGVASDAIEKRRRGGRAYRIMLLTRAGRRDGGGVGRRDSTIRAMGSGWPDSSNGRSGVGDVR